MNYRMIAQILLRKPNTDRYIDRRNTLFSGGRYNALDKSCYVEFLHILLSIKNSSEYQPDDFKIN